MTEAQFTRLVIDTAYLGGWKPAHFRPAMTRKGKWVTPVQGDGKGFTDLVLVHAKRKLVVFVELKVGKNSLTPEQKEWETTLVNAGANYALWRPEDWDEIESFLLGDLRKER